MYIAIVKQQRGEWSNNNDGSENSSSGQHNNAGRLLPWKKSIRIPYSKLTGRWYY